MSPGRRPASGLPWATRDETHANELKKVCAQFLACFKDVYELEEVTVLGTSVPEAPRV